MYEFHYNSTFIIQVSSICSFWQCGDFIWCVSHVSFLLFPANPRPGVSWCRDLLFARMVVGQVEAAGFEVNNIDALHYSSTIWGWYLKWVEGGACPSSYLAPLLTCILFYRTSPRLIPHLGLLPCLPHHRLTFL